MTEARLADIQSPLFVDPQTLMDDPHARFAALREAHPVIQTGERQYMALRADYVLAMLSDPRTKQIDGVDYAAARGVPDGYAARFLRDFFLFGDGESHRAKRGLFARSFAFGAIRERQVLIRDVADALVRELPRGETFDFVERMAARLPAEMIATILGLPASESTHFAPLVYEVARALGPTYPRADHASIETAAQALFTYLEEHLRSRLAAPRDDLLSTLAAGWAADPVISFESLVNQVVGVVIGGSDTTRAAFAMLVALLLQHPREWAAVKADPSLIPGAVAEGLRYEPSVGSFARFTTAPLAIGDVRVPMNAMLRVSTMSAMRDPALYAEPNRFDVRRTDHPRLHAVFGLGPHRCIGEMLARLEMQTGLAALIAAGVEIEMLAPPRMQGFGGIREITPMPVRLH